MKWARLLLDPNFTIANSENRWRVGYLTEPGASKPNSYTLPGQEGLFDKDGRHFFSDSDGGEWIQCPDYVAIGWHYANGGFTSPNGYGYWECHLASKGLPPLEPNWMDITTFYVKSMDEYEYLTFKIDVSNTTVENLKRNILRKRAPNMWGISHVASWKEMTSEELKSIKAGGWSPDFVHTKNRLWSAILGETVTAYDNGKKINITSKQRIALQPDHELLAHFELEEDYPIVMNLTSLIERPQWMPDPWEIILDLVS